MMNKLVLSTHFWRTLLINDEKAAPRLFLTHVLNSFICRNSFILTTRAHNLLATRTL